MRVQKRDRIVSLDEVTQMLLKLTGGEAPFPDLAEEAGDKPSAVLSTNAPSLSAIGRGALPDRASWRTISSTRET